MKFVFYTADWNETVLCIVIKELKESCIDIDNDFEDNTKPKINLLKFIPQDIFIIDIPEDDSVAKVFNANDIIVKKYTTSRYFIKDNEIYSETSYTHSRNDSPDTSCIIGIPLVDPRFIHECEDEESLRLYLQVEANDIYQKASKVNY